MINIAFKKKEEEGEKKKNRGKTFNLEANELKMKAIFSMRENERGEGEEEDSLQELLIHMLLKEKKKRMRMLEG